jgi:hypothetical protein
MSPTEAVNGFSRNDAFERLPHIGRQVDDSFGDTADHVRSGTVFLSIVSSFRHLNDDLHSFGSFLSIFVHLKSERHLRWGASVPSGDHWEQHGFVIDTAIRRGQQK